MSLFGELQSTPGEDPKNGDKSRAVLRRYGHAHIEVTTSAPGPRVLVINDVWHPWWRATIDGQDATIVRANAIFRAVAVPSGDHVVRLEFSPLQGLVAEVTTWLTGLRWRSLAFAEMRYGYAARAL